MKNDSIKKIEEILNSLDESQKASIPDFFYTRLKAKMLARQEAGDILLQTQGGLERAAKKSWMVRPAFALTALATVLLMNAVVIFNGDATNENTTTDSESLQSIAAEYSLLDNSSVYDLNPDK